MQQLTTVQRIIQLTTVQQVINVAYQNKASSGDTTTTSSNIHDELAKSYEDEHQAQHLPEGSAVPSSRTSRAFGFASLGAGLAIGTVSELAKRTFGASQSKDPIVLSNDANAEHLSASLR